MSDQCDEGGSLNETQINQTEKVNVLANALLASSLQHLLRSTLGNPSRMVFVTSEGHAMVPSDFAQDEKLLARFAIQPYSTSFDHYQHYYLSKLFGLLWALAFARRVDPEKVSIVLASPGLCHSNLFRDVRSVPSNFLAWCFARPSSDGARILLTAALACPQRASIYPGDTYFSQGRVVP